MDLAANLGLIENDNRVDELRVVRTVLGGQTVVSIWPM
jgi:hypothetical protein